MVPSPEPTFPELPVPENTVEDPVENDRERRKGIVRTRFLHIASRTSAVDSGQLWGHSRVPYSGHFRLTSVIRYLFLYVSLRVI